ncbi:hypothetical protein ACINK0_05545 [Deinococcus sp. VB343]|uniref:Uncharacterized protein n=1 Tax=Deinococcus sp. VB142 TaxID=3112952 RepID=A0AAU6Q6K4_9DEIO
MRLTTGEVGRVQAITPPNAF